MAVTVSVDINRVRLNNFLYGPSGPVVRKVRNWSHSVRRQASAYAPKATAELANSGDVEVTPEPGARRVVGTIAFRAKHSLWVHEGTRGPIRPKRSKYLKFRAGPGFRGRGGRAPFYYVTSVSGQKPNPFLVLALILVMVPRGARIKRFRGRRGR